jgi:hypothetical protein
MTGNLSTPVPLIFVRILTSLCIFLWKMHVTPPATQPLRTVILSEAKDPDFRGFSLIERY